MSRTRVLVVDDSLFMRKLISSLIEEDVNIVVVGVAKNGSEAIKLAKELKPDVITLDVEMPIMNGLEALIQIMKEIPTPVIMLSSLTHEGASETIEALQSGAVDFIPKPSGSISADLYMVQEEMISKIKSAAQTSKSALRPILRSRAIKPYGVVKDKAITGNQDTRKIFDQVIVLGTSTGGPRALDTVIGSLPGNFPYPILVVQHMPPKFTTSLAQRLDRTTSLRVVEAEDNELIVGGTVYIAPGNFHMTAAWNHNRELRIKLNQEALRSGHRPSVDVLFESVAKLNRLKCHYVLMTGMGSDGAKGMLLAKESGSASTIAEAKETCVVYGMPRSAIEYNCVDHVVPVDQIAAKIIEITKSASRN